MEEGDGGGPEVGEDGLDMKAKECREPKLVLIFGNSQNEEEGRGIRCGNTVLYHV